VMSVWRRSFTSSSLDPSGPKPFFSHLAHRDVSPSTLAARRAGRHQIFV